MHMFRTPYFWPHSSKIMPLKVHGTIYGVVCMSMDLSQTIAESSATSDMGVLTSYTLYNFILFYSFLFLFKKKIYIFFIFSYLLSMDVS